MKLKKLLMTTGLTFGLVVMFALTSFAGKWHWGDYGWWYELSDGSYAKNGLWSIDGEKYAFDSHGWMISNDWFQGTKGWYYCTNSGAVARNQWVGNYYMGSDGIMLTNTWTPDGYYVNELGEYDPSMGGGNKDEEISEYYTIDGNWDNRDQSGYSKDNRVDLWINVDPGDAYLATMDFGLYMSSGTPYSLYDSVNPNGDSLKIATVDGLNWGCRSTISDKWYDMTYNGKDTITLYWRSTAWTSSGKLIFKRRSGGRLLNSWDSGSGGVG
ncbi:hypothetical protein [Oribacterium sp. WCC10]|uniref:hypothetical protein n=1 Tax=Oribacterium sp. WCC10 TaxID=1855343 RepID=UPI0008E85BA8|nr:hypothetical protein [Oribacterium sp. WCC10]SFG63692.1 hypothetical protein SAMN05216356_11635 [Oribacterium sp. WCC10]